MKQMKYKIFNENCLDVLDRLKENYIDSIVTDPPYGLTSITKRFGKNGSAPAQYGKDGSFARLSKGFMGKEWDGSGIEYNVEMWKKCLRVLKPGGYLLAFGGSRTFHRIACAIEDAGFEIRDTIMWLYGSGMPKFMNIEKAINKSDKELKEKAKIWHGYATALKPSYEAIIMARKPLDGTYINNVLEWNVGAINVDECRIAFNGDKWNTQKSGKTSRAYQSIETTTAGGICEPNDNGRYPSNTILTYDDADFEEVCGGFPITNNNSASRYFYNAKTSRKDRDCDGTVNNIHPTCKPTALMQYLIRLVTPRGGIVLDPFMGSGSTGKAAAYENLERDADYKFVGIELDKEYCDIATARIEYVNSQTENKNNKEEEKNNE